MTKIIDEDVQYKEGVKCLSSLVVATMRAEAKETLDELSASAVTLGADDAGKVLLCVDAVVTLPEPVTGRVVELVCMSLTGVMVVTSASTDQIYDTAGTGVTAAVLPPFCINSLLAVDGSSWVATLGTIPANPQ